jgi:hypothetical protein
MPYASPASNLKPLASSEAKPLGSFPLTPCALRLAPCARETTDNGPLALSLSKDHHGLLAPNLVSKKNNLTISYESPRVVDVVEELARVGPGWRIASDQ